MYLIADKSNGRVFVSIGLNSQYLNKEYVVVDLEGCKSYHYGDNKWYAITVEEVNEIPS